MKYNSPPARSSLTRHFDRGSPKLKKAPESVRSIYNLKITCDLPIVYKTPTSLLRDLTEKVYSPRPKKDPSLANLIYSLGTIMKERKSLELEFNLTGKKASASQFDNHKYEAHIRKTRNILQRQKPLSRKLSKAAQLDPKKTWNPSIKVNKW